MLKVVKNLIVVAVAGMAGLMAGCGGGGDTGATVLNGTASKGIIYPGTVSIYAVNSGEKSSTALITVQTDQNGKFTADLGQYSGAIVIEASGKYTDEASAATVTIDAANPLRAVINDARGATGRKRCAVTPLTDLAYSLMAGAPLTNENIGTMNKRVADIFKITDITGTEPVRPDAAVLGASGVSEEQRVYTIALATLSQMAKNANGGKPATFAQIKDILGSFKNDLAAAPNVGLVPANTSAFTNALATVTAPTSTLGGFAAVSSALQAVSRSEIRLTLATGTVPTGTLIGGIQGTITLPEGASIRTEGVPETVLSGQFIAPKSLALAGYKAATRTVNYGLVYGSGFSGGDFATLLIDVQIGVPVTASDFTLSGSNVIDTALRTMNIPIIAK